MLPLISIIMPIYNADKFLAKSLDSILNQSFQEYELILLNDGSKDNSSAIAKEYAQRDKRITFIDKENEGVSKTRNRGIDICQGKYVMFVDSDDIIYEISLERVTEALLDFNPDFLKYEFQTIDELGDALYPNYNAKRRIP